MSFFYDTSDGKRCRTDRGTAVVYLAAFAGAASLLYSIFTRRK